MPFKPNYNHQRAERDRAKQAKKEAKLAERAERKKAGLDPDTGEALTDEAQPGDAADAAQPAEHE